eukprot:jgi/Botrbrau1/20666/Bobra.0545s0001.1
MLVHRQVLLLLKGHPGSGKSTLARLLAQRLHWTLVDKDDARDCFTTLEGTVGKDELNALSYSVMWRIVDTQLSCSNCVIVDCPLARWQLYNVGLQLARKHMARVLVVECETLDQEVWKMRLEARGERDAATSCSHKPCSWEELQLLLKGYKGCDAWTGLPDQAPEHHLRLDTSSTPPADLTALVVDRLRTLVSETSLQGYELGRGL